MRSDTQLWTRHEMDMGDGMPEEVFHMPATPEEVKAAHGKCKTCKQYGFITKDDDPTYIDHVCDWDMLTIQDPATDYCNHHEPKEE